MSILTKMTIRTILINLVILGLTLLGGIYGFDFFVKAFFYLITPLGIIITIAFHNSEFLERIEATDMQFFMRKQSKGYQLVDHSFDIAFLAAFVFLNYKALFVWWLIYLLCSASSYNSIRNYIKDKNIDVYKN